MLIVTAAIPLGAALGAHTAVTAVLGGVAALGVGLRQLYGWQKNHAVQARTYSQIDAEIARFMASTSCYKPADIAAAKLVCRVENIMLAEGGRGSARPPHGDTQHQTEPRSSDQGDEDE